MNSFGSTLAVLTKAAALSFKRQYVLCIDGTRARRFVMFILKTVQPCPTIPASGTIDGLHGAGHCVGTPKLQATEQAREHGANPCHRRTDCSQFCGIL